MEEHNSDDGFNFNSLPCSEYGEDSPRDNDNLESFKDLDFEKNKPKEEVNVSSLEPPECENHSLPNDLKSSKDSDFKNNMDNKVETPKESFGCPKKTINRLERELLPSFVFQIFCGFGSEIYPDGLIGTAFLVARDTLASCEHAVFFRGSKRTIIAIKNSLGMYYEGDEIEVLKKKDYCGTSYNEDDRDYIFLKVPGLSNTLEDKGLAPFLELLSGAPLEHDTPIKILGYEAPQMIRENLHESLSMDWLRQDREDKKKARKEKINQFVFKQEICEKEGRIVVFPEGHESRQSPNPNFVYTNAKTENGISGSPILALTPEKRWDEKRWVVIGMHQGTRPYYKNTIALSSFALQEAYKNDWAL